MNWTTFLAAIALVESGGDPQAAGDGGRALGCLQIHHQVVQDVNRVYRLHLSHRDALDPVKARLICRLYLDHYGRRYCRLTGKVDTLDILARIWNGGPDGWRKPATEKYGQRVRAALPPEPGT